MCIFFCAYTYLMSSCKVRLILNSQKKETSATHSNVFLDFALNPCISKGTEKTITYSSSMLEYIIRTYQIYSWITQVQGIHTSFRYIRNSFFPAITILHDPYLPLLVGSTCHGLQISSMIIRNCRFKGLCANNLPNVDPQMS